MDPVHEQNLSDPEKRLDDYIHTQGGQQGGVDPDAKYGGHQARIVLEKKLLWKLDLRMSILIFIYILNYVSYLISSWPYFLTAAIRSTETMLRQL